MISRPLWPARDSAEWREFSAYSSSSRFPNAVAPSLREHFRRAEISTAFVMETTNAGSSSEEEQVMVLWSGFGSEIFLGASSVFFHSIFLYLKYFVVFFNSWGYWGVSDSDKTLVSALWAHEVGWTHICLAALLVGKIMQNLVSNTIVPGRNGSFRNLCSPWIRKWARNPQRGSFTLDDMIVSWLGEMDMSLWRRTNRSLSSLLKCRNLSLFKMALFISSSTYGGIPISENSKIIPAWSFPFANYAKSCIR